MIQKLNLYCDESCQNNHHYLVIGSIVCETYYVKNVIDEIRSIKNKYNQTGELKWEKVKPRHLAKYIDIVDKFFELQTHNILHYHAIIIDCYGLNHAKYNCGDSEIGFNKFIYQLLLKHCRIYHEDTDYYVYLDDRTTSHGLGLFREIVNKGAKKKFNVEPFRIIEFKDSKEFELIQLADLFTGAIGYRKNEKDILLPNSNNKTAKDDLSEHIRKKANIRSLCDTTPSAIKNFTIWNFQLQPR